MKKPSLLLAYVFLAIAAISILGAGQAVAFDEFQKAWQKKYIGEEKTEVEKKLAKEVMEVKKCNVCHNPNKVDGKISKKYKNAYGEALDKLLSKDDKKDADKINKALAEVEKLKDEKDKDAKDAPTFGDLLKEGKLPSIIKPEKDGDKDADKDDK